MLYLHHTKYLNHAQPRFQPSNCFILQYSQTFSTFTQYMSVSHGHSSIGGIEYGGCEEDKKEEDSLTSTRSIIGLWWCPSIDINVSECNTPDVKLPYLEMYPTLSCSIPSGFPLCGFHFGFALFPIALSCHYLSSFSMPSYVASWSYQVQLCTCHAAFGHSCCCHEHHVHYPCHPLKPCPCFITFPSPFFYVLQVTFYPPLMSNFSPKFQHHAQDLYAKFQLYLVVLVRFKNDPSLN